MVSASLALLSDLYNYNHWIFNKVRPFIGGRVCEVGCGIGNITQFLLNAEAVVGIEPQRACCEHVRQRFADHLNLRFVQCQLADCPSREVPTAGFDTVVCLNVLEHIEDDVGSLVRMRQLCGPKGRVVILVPAHMHLYGQLDRSFGHYRRYNRAGLRKTFAAAGLKPVYSTYMNALGCLGWWWHSRCRKRRQIPRDASRFFNRLVPFLDAAERLVPPPFGQSLIMVGTTA